MRAVRWAWHVLQRPVVSWLVRAAVAAGLIGLLAIFVDFPAAVEAVGDVSPFLFVAAVAVALGAWLINSLKWWLLLQPLDPGPGPLRLFGWNLRGIFYGQLLPGMLAGEAVKGYRLYRETGSAAPVIISIGADRLAGLVALALLGSLALVRSPDLRGDEFYIGIVGGFGVLVPVLLLAMFTPSAIGWVRKLENRPLLSGLVRRGGEVIQAYQGRYPLLAVTLLLAVTFQALGAIVVYLLGLGIDMDVGLVDFLWVYAAVSLVSLLPIALGGLGAREATFILLLGPLGVDSEEALTLGFLVLGVQLALALMGGGLELKAVIWPNSRSGDSLSAGLVLQSESLRGLSKDA